MSGVGSTEAPATPNAIAGYTVGAVIAAFSLTITVLMLYFGWAKHAGATISMVVSTHKKFQGKLSDKVLFAFRLITLLFVGGSMIYGLTVPVNLKFYTYWNFGLLCCYFLVQVIVSALHMSGVLAKNKTFENVVTQLTIVMFEVVHTMTLLVDFVYWTLLYGLAPNPAAINYTTIVYHAMNFLIMNIEFSVNNIPYRPADVMFVINWAIAWMIFQFVWAYYTDNWIYYFANVYATASAAWYVGLVAGHVVAFYIMFGGFMLKMRLVGDVPYYRVPADDVTPMKQTLGSDEF